MRYTAFKLTTEESIKLSNHLDAGLDMRLDVIKNEVKTLHADLRTELKRTIKVTFMDAALNAFENDGLVKYELFNAEGGNSGEVPVMLFWINDKPIARKSGATHQGEVLAGLMKKDQYIDRIMEEVLIIGQSHPEYVSEILYSAYLQAKDTIAQHKGTFWTKKRKNEALEVLEDVYGLYLVEPVSHGEVA
jgi:hypothetical protein